MIQGPEGVTAFGFVTSYERKGFYACEEIEAHIGEIEHADYDGDRIDMGSSRYRLFAANRVCVSCGLEGAFYAKERAARFSKATQTYHPTTNKWHFNLYAVSEHGHLILMTKDHIIPKSRGGGNIDTNYQTMCQPCNMRKSNRMPGESDRDFYLQRRPQSNDPRNRAQRAADRRSKREIVKTIKRADAAAGIEVTHCAWGGYTGEPGGRMGSEIMRSIYARNWLVFDHGTPRKARLFQVDGLTDQYQHLAKGWWWPDKEAAEVKIIDAVGFGNQSAARAFMKGLIEAADVLDAAAKVVEDAKAEARREEQRRHNAWVKAKDAECAACVGARERTIDKPWGVVVGACDTFGLTSHHLVDVKKWLVFTGGCHGTGSLFETHEIVSPSMHTVTGWWRFSGTGKVLGPKHAHNVNHATAGFDTKDEAMKFIHTLHAVALQKVA